jgi:putative (di)nucleoside polyphosphate hydrolase
MPQGGIDPGETPETAVFREMKEEIGTNRAEIIGESHHWLTYDLPPELVGKVWKGRYRGQQQKWFALRFTGDDSEITVATDHPEFSDWRWIGLSSLLDLIVPFKRDLYQAVVTEFAPIAQRLAAQAAG